MSTQTVSLADIRLTDDLDVGVNPETYVDQGPPPPPPAGNYEFRVLKHSIRTDQEGNVILVDGRFPIIVLDMLEIVQPIENARKIAAFLDIRTKPFERNGNPASTFADLIRAYDQTLAWQGLEEGKQALLEFFNSGATFRARLDWTGYDKDYADSEFAKLGLAKKDVPKETANAIYAGAKIKGMRNFPRYANGKFNPVWVNPKSGNLVEARVDIPTFYASGKDVQLGPTHYSF